MTFTIDNNLQFVTKSRAINNLEYRALIARWRAPISELVSCKCCREWDTKYSWRDCRVLLQFYQTRLVKRELWKVWRKWSTHVHQLTRNGVKKKANMQLLASTVEQDQALANLWDGLISAETPASATNNQPTPQTVEEKSYNVNVSLFHEFNLILFARGRGKTKWEKLHQMSK